MSRLGKQCSALLLKFKYTRKAKYHDQLMTLTWNHLMGVAGLYLRNKTEIEDILQNAFLRVCQYINSYQDDQDGFNWLYRIVQHESYNHNQSLTPTVPLETAYMRPVEEDFTEQIENEMIISECLQPYDEQDRQIILLYFLDNLSIRKIAAKLGLKKSHAHKRLKLVAEEILANNRKTVDN
ncbi:MAG: sigma-70 family RNA polymerase sigma factor [Clostridia bacterium]|nr:sigma-70 family RNA polymerase sigma factor [Clostridia bacterium]